MTALRANLDRSASAGFRSGQLQNLALLQLAIVVLALVGMALQAG